MPYESDPIAAKLNDLVMREEMYAVLFDFEGLNAAEKALVGTWELMNEVYNGGFMQYFHNSSRENAVPMKSVLRTMGADRAADILSSAIDLVGPGTRYGDEPNFITAVEALPSELRAKIADLELNLYEGADDLHLRLFRYLSQHREQIDAPQEFWNEEATS